MLKNKNSAEIFKWDKIKHSWSFFPWSLYMRCQLEPWSRANLILFAISLSHRHTQMSQVVHYPNSLIRTDWCSLSPEIETLLYCCTERSGLVQNSLSPAVIIIRGTVAVLQTVSSFFHTRVYTNTLNNGLMQKGFLKG